ncbi:hypothetical protein BZA77DRAFT_364164 [Pyronema omphalodes]|nr:hypothetical protein BZA77DRAFT_364164 [Pyronema omphalodes]
MSLHVAFLPVILPILIIMLIIGGLCLTQALVRAYPSIWDFFAACCRRRRRPRRYMRPPSRVLTPEERRERLISNARYLQRVRDEEIRAQQQNTHNMDLEAGIELASLAALIGNGGIQATQHSRPRAGSRAVPRQSSRLEGPSHHNTPPNTTTPIRAPAVPRPVHTRTDSPFPAERLTRTAPSQRVSTPIAPGPGRLSSQGAVVPPNFASHHRVIDESLTQQSAVGLPGVARTIHRTTSGAASTVDPDQLGFVFVFWVLGLGVLDLKYSKKTGFLAVYPSLLSFSVLLQPTLLVVPMVFFSWWLVYALFTHATANHSQTFEFWPFTAGCFGGPVRKRQVVRIRSSKSYVEEIWG